MFAVIAENDESSWEDLTGELYHFPARYLKLLKPGTRVIYYKGKQRDSKYKDDRLSTDPHYFGIATIGQIEKDSKSKKSDYFAKIELYAPFLKAVPIKINAEILEPIPATKQRNYWRDGVREISKSSYDKILSLSSVEEIEGHEPEQIVTDLYQGSEDAFTSYSEGNKKDVFRSVYERNPKLRQKAIEIHGYNCMACGFNFKAFYGTHGVEFIHVHHIKPISEKGGVHEVNPKTDLITLCANCHAMIHRKRGDTLSLERLVGMIRMA